MHKDSLKTEVSGERLKVKFVADCTKNAYVRVNTCVTEKKNPNNVPTMFYTPNKQNYISELKLQPGNA